MTPKLVSVPLYLVCTLALFPLPLSYPPYNTRLCIQCFKHCRLFFSDSLRTIQIQQFSSVLEGRSVHVQIDTINSEVFDWDNGNMYGILRNSASVGIKIKIGIEFGILDIDIVYHSHYNQAGTEDGCVVLFDVEDQLQYLRQGGKQEGEICVCSLW